MLCLMFSAPVCDKGLKLSDRDRVSRPGVLVCIVTQRTRGSSLSCPNFVLLPCARLFVVVDSVVEGGYVRNTLGQTLVVNF